MQSGRLVRPLLAVALLIGAGSLMLSLVGDLNRVKALKTDLAEIHHVRFGLLDPDVWVARIGEILQARVEELDLTQASRAQVTAAVTQLLDTLIREIERNLAQPRPDPGGSWLDQLQGALQQGLQDLLLDVARLRERVPEYADAFVEQLSVPGVKEQIKARLQMLLRDAVASSGAESDRRPLEAVLARYGCADTDACSRLLEREIGVLQARIQPQLAAVIGLLALVFVVALIGGTRRAQASDKTADRRLAPVLLFALVGATVLLLLGGLATPMIQIDARIAKLAFQLLGEPVVFTEQVLYFQTKSIFDVMRILFESGQADMWLVAVLLTLFSVVFPALKLLATYAFYNDWMGSRRSRTVRFFALKSGKWSMADVMVVAIFMAYIGFDALLSNQLASLGGARDTLTVLTTNATSLEPGFYLFLSFVLAGLVLSSALENRLDRDR